MLRRCLPQSLRSQLHAQRIRSFHISAIANRVVSTDPVKAEEATVGHYLFVILSRVLNQLPEFTFFR